MSDSCKAGVALTLLAGVVIGVVLVGATTTAVHWAGSVEFCSSWCHTMDPAVEAYKRGQHFKTNSGVTAGCSDCHLRYETEKEINPFQYIGLLYDKAYSGTVSLLGQITGSIDTREKWEARRAEMSETVIKKLTDTGYANCLGCHNLDMMNKPGIGDFHRGMKKAGQTNCMQCHKKAGHAYEEAKK